MRRVLLCVALMTAACAGPQTPRSRAGTSSSAQDGGPNFTLTVPISPQEAAGVASSRVPEPTSTRAPLVEAAPDPEPLASVRQFEYELVYDRGDVSVRGTRVRVFGRPVVTARRVGRFAIELWIGRELVDRVRFDFPIIGAEPVLHGSRRPLDAPPSLLPGAVVTRRVLVPASARATRALLVDRATGEKRELPWPPDAPLAPVTIEDVPPDSPAGSVDPVRDEAASPR